MKTTVVSGFSPRGYIETGKAFIRTFDRYWPKEVELVVYVEEKVKNIERGTQRLLWEIPGCRDFIESHQEAKYNGKEEVPGWRKKDLLAGYSYRFDAVKFCRQLFIPDHCAGYLPDGDILVWFDSDVVTYAEVPGNFVAGLLGDNDLITLGRRDSPSDLGFWAVRLNSNIRSLLRSIADCYRTNTVFTLPEWHSGYVFDHFVTKYRDSGAIKHKLLTWRRNGHVWFDCEIGRYTDHLKGPIRKQMGYSPERNGNRLKNLIHG